MTGGEMTLESQEGVGTTVTARFRLGHIDLMPLGDMAATIAGLMQCNPDKDFVYTLRVDGEAFTADSREMKQILGGEVSLAEPSVALFIRQFIEENSAPLLDKGEEAL